MFLDRLENRHDMAVSQMIQDALTVPQTDDEAGLTQNFELVRNGRLRQSDCLNDFIDRKSLFKQEIKDAVARIVAECLENLNAFFGFF